MSPASTALPSSTPDVLLVGAGVSGLLAALELSRAGCRVEVVARGADPRSGAGPERLGGATLRGERTRYVSPYEGHPYLGHTPMYPHMGQVLLRPLSRGGWLGRPLAGLSGSERTWLARRQVAHEAQGLVEESFRFYREVHLLSLRRWAELRRALPGLFHDVREGLLRLFLHSPELHAWSRAQHAADGVLLEDTPGEALPLRYPALREPYEGGLLAGALRSEGFSFDIHAFAQRLLGYLEEQGVRVRFGTEAVRLERGASGRVRGLRVREEGSGTEELLVARHYSLHVGAYGAGGLLRGTPVEGRLCGVVGRWVLLPAPEGLEHSLKLHRPAYRVEGQPRAAVDLNLGLLSGEGGARWLVVGGGYGWVGEQPEALEPAERATMDAENVRTVLLLFPSAAGRARREGTLRVGTRQCTRSFTWDDLPLLEASLPTEAGGVVLFTGGTNTGTTAVAPVEAGLVAATLGRAEGRAPEAGSPLAVLAERLEQLTRASAALQAERAQEVRRWEEQLRSGPLASNE